VPLPSESVREPVATQSYLFASAATRSVAIGVPKPLAASHPCPAEYPEIDAKSLLPVRMSRNPVVPLLVPRLSAYRAGLILPRSRWADWSAIAAIPAHWGQCHVA